MKIIFGEKIKWHSVFSFRIGSGKQNTNVIVDDGKDDDDDETFVVEDNHAITNDIDTVSKGCPGPWVWPRSRLSKIRGCI